MSVFQKNIKKIFSRREPKRGMLSFFKGGGGNRASDLLKVVKKKYDADPSSCEASGGIGMCFRIYRATHRVSKKKVSVFVFDKTDLQKRCAKSEEFLQILRDGIKNLQRLRHPRLLELVDLFPETRKAIVFVTERVSCSLANSLNNTINIPKDKHNMAMYTKRDVSSFEGALGILHTAEALLFLHQINKLHLSVSTENIFIKPSGAWKLGGFGFCTQISRPGESVPFVLFQNRKDVSTTAAITTSSSTTTEQVIRLYATPPLRSCAPVRLLLLKNFII